MKRPGKGALAYQKVEALLAKKPALTKIAAIKLAGVDPKNYFQGQAASRKRAGLTSSKKAPPQASVELRPTAEAGKLMVLIGTPEQIREVIQ